MPVLSRYFTVEYLRNSCHRVRAFAYSISGGIICRPTGCYDNFVPYSRFIYPRDSYLQPLWEAVEGSALSSKSHFAYSPCNEDANRYLICSSSSHSLNSHPLSRHWRSGSLVSRSCSSVTITKCPGASRTWSRLFAYLSVLRSPRVGSPLLNTPWSYSP